jgi:hypothetical protein
MKTSVEVTGRFKVMVDIRHKAAFYTCFGEYLCNGNLFLWYAMPSWLEAQVVSLMRDNLPAGEKSSTSKVYPPGRQCRQRFGIGLPEDYAILSQ